MSHGIVWMMRQEYLILLYRRLKSALCCVVIAEVEVGLDKIGL
jgi:hypothetical protein